MSLPGAPPAKNFSFRRNLSVVQKVIAVVGALASTIAAIFAYRELHPHDFTPELQRAFTVQLRRVYQDDLRLDPSEASETDAFIERNKLRPDTVRVFQKDLMQRIAKASQDIDRGLDLVRAKRFADARREFLSAATVDPENPAAWADLGAADMELGRTEEGRVFYDKAILLAPGDRLLHYNFGFFFIRVKNSDAAIGQFRLALTPQNRTTIPSDKTMAAVLRDAETNPLLDPIRKDRRFQELLKAAKDEH